MVAGGQLRALQLDCIFVEQGCKTVVITWNVLLFNLVLVWDLRTCTPLRRFDGSKSSLSGFLPSSFTYHSHLVLAFPSSDHVHVWRIAVSKFLILVELAYVVSAQGGIFFSNTANSPVFSSSSVVPAPFLSRLFCRLENFSFVEIVCGKFFDPFSSYLAFPVSQEIDCTVVHSSDPFSCFVRPLYRRWTCIRNRCTP